MCIWASVISVSVHGQTFHTLSPEKEAAIGGIGLGFHGLGAWKAGKYPVDHVPRIDLANVPMIDRVATRQWSVPAHRTSNVLFGLAVGASLAVSIADQHGEQPLLPVVILAESALLCSGITNTVKEFVGRPRPYLYNPDVPQSAYHGHADNVSFWSGHTANTAAITFACAGMVQRSDASKGMKTATWIGAAVTPAAMGYLRVKAGKHFRTDVLTGYAVGALVGWAVPYFHRSKEQP